MTGNEFDTIYKLYLRALPSMKKSALTVSHYELILRRFAQFVKDEPNITALTVVEWREALFDDVACNTIINYMTTLHTFFQWAYRKKFIEENPVQPEDFPQPERIKYDLLTHNEIKLLLSKRPMSMNKKTGCRNRAIVVLLVQTGMRNSELRALRLSDLDFTNSTITIEHGKGDKKRKVPFPALAQTAVKEYLDDRFRPKALSDDDFLFGTDADSSGHSTGGKVWKPLSAVALQGMIRVYVERTTGHEGGVKVHALRHAYASLCDEMGVSLRDVQNSLGHSSLATTEHIYVTVLDKNKSAVNINKAFDGVFA